MADIDLVLSLLDWDDPQPSIRSLTSVTSTNDIAWAWAEARCPEWTVVLADEQVRGRGRFGRTWHCPRGQGLLMSVVLRPPDAAMGPAHVTALAALAAAEAVEAYGPATRLKWPNDVVVGTRKIAGVLVERRGQSGPCVLGIGINVSTPRDAFPPDLRDAATSIAAETGDAPSIESVAATVLQRLRLRCRQALSGEWPRVSDEWKGRCSLPGQRVTLESAGNPFHGRVVSVDPLAGIHLKLDTGEDKVFLAERTTLHTQPTHSCT